jgi:ABC-type uncharacterized transport system permease subunit
MARGRLRSFAGFYTAVVVGISLQLLALYQRGLHRLSLPVGNPFEVIQTVVLCMALSVLVIAPVRFLRNLSVFVVGLGAILLALALQVKPWDSPGPLAALSALDPWLQVHTLFAVLSYGLFALIALHGFLYLLQDYGLCHKQFGGVFRLLPSLHQLGCGVYYCLHAGVVFLVLTLLIGLGLKLTHPGAIHTGKLWLGAVMVAAYTALWLAAVRQWLHPKALAAWAVALFVLSLGALWPLSFTTKWS